MCSLCDIPTDVVVRIQSDYDDLVEFARALASAITFEEESTTKRTYLMGYLGDWHDAQIEQARTLCDALGVDWESDE